MNEISNSEFTFLGTLPESAADLGGRALRDPAGNIKAVVFDRKLTDDEIESVKARLQSLMANRAAQ